MKATLVTVCLAVVTLLAPAVARAGKLTCLTGTDPSVANDLSQIVALRALIDSACSCSNATTHGAYLTCAKGVIATAISGSSLRKQCSATITKDYGTSTCGVPASKGVVPCLKKVLTSGKVSCAIKPAAKCTGTGKFNQVSCPNEMLCIDAADTNGDGIIGAGDSGGCTAAAATPTHPPSGTATPTATPAPNTPAPAPTSTPNHCTDGILNGNETDIDCGGGTCPPCVGSKQCSVDSDCQSSACSAGLCQQTVCCDGYGGVCVDTVSSAALVDARCTNSGLSLVVEAAGTFCDATVGSCGAVKRSDRCCDGFIGTCINYADPAFDALCTMFSGQVHLGVSCGPVSGTCGGS